MYYFSEEDTRKDILEFAKEQETETLRARKDALDGVIFEILLERWDKEEEVKVATVTSVFNEESKSKGYKNEFTEKRIGNIIRKILGFETERRGHDKSYWVVRNLEIEASKKEYYGIPPLFESAQVPQVPQTKKNNKNIIGISKEIFLEEETPF